MRCSPRLLWLSLAGSLLLPISAEAAVTRAQLTLDAVAGDVAAASTTNNGLDLATAPDGSAIAAWVQHDTGFPHIYAARYIGGSWTAAQRIDDVGLSSTSTAPTVGIGNGGVATVVFASGAPGSENLYAVTAASNAAAFSSATPIGGAAGWSRPDLAVGSTGNGYLVASTSAPNDDVRAYKLTAGAFVAVGGVYPDANGRLDLTPANLAAASEAERARVAVDATGATATITWTERIGSARSVVARKLSGTGLAQIGTAVVGDVASFDGRSLVNTGASGQDQLSIVTGGSTTWIAHRAFYNYAGGDKSRALVRTFDGTTWGSAAAVDAPEASTVGASSPVLAVNASGTGIATSELGAPLNSGVIARMSGGTWARGALVPSTGNQAAAAITPGGTGLAVFNDLNDPTESIILGRTVGGSQSGLAEELSGSAGQRKRSAVAAPLTDGALVVWRQGVGPASMNPPTATSARIWAAKIDLPGGTEPGTGGGGTTDGDVATITALRLSKKRVKRTTKRPLVLTAASGTYLEITLGAAAKVTFTLEREQPGRRVSGTCRKQSSANRKRPKCTYRTSLGKQRLTLDLPSGMSRIRFGGRLGGKSAPPKGAYRLTATTATAASTDQTTTKRLSFTLR